MLEDISGIGKIFEVLTDLIKFTYWEYDKKKTVKKDEMSKFMNVASEALRETLRYLGREPYTRDRKKEEKLSDLWDKVASAAYPFNPDLAQRCYLKAGYWAAPEHWTGKQLDAARIRISEMEKEIGELFGSKKKKVRKSRENGK